MYCVYDVMSRILFHPRHVAHLCAHCCFCYLITFSCCVWLCVLPLSRLPIHLRALKGLSCVKFGHHLQALNDLLCIALAGMLDFVCFGTQKWVQKCCEVRCFLFVPSLGYGLLDLFKLSQSCSAPSLLEASYLPEWFTLRFRNFVEPLSFWGLHFFRNDLLYASTILLSP
jgi:hypothetical protein